MSYGTSDSTVISPITTEAHNLNTTIASAAQRDNNVFPANVQANTAENYQNHTFSSQWEGHQNQLSSIFPRAAVFPHSSDGIDLPDFTHGGDG